MGILCCVWVCVWLKGLSAAGAEQMTAARHARQFIDTQDLVQNNPGSVVKILARWPPAAR